MVTTVNPPAGAANPRVNLIGLERADYKGNPSTLCQGCGHDSISSQIMAVAYELSLPPYRIMKMSGIGCSSKSPAYFLNRSHGFNALHGRMPSVTTGATTVNRAMQAIAVSGDGDTGSIGFGQFKHLLRRNVQMVYIVENNGVYGLTKGQFSATADQGQKLKYAGTNALPPIDLCMEGLIAHCGFIARSFAGDAKQVRELLKAALNFHGTALLDIISPCVTFNNHEESTKSYSYGKAHEEKLHDITFVPKFEEVTVDYAPGEVVSVKLHDGPTIQLRKLDKGYDPRDRTAAFRLLQEAETQHEFLTGLIYIDESRPTLVEVNNLVETPLVQLAEAQLRPSREALAQVMAGLG